MADTGLMKAEIKRDILLRCIPAGEIERIARPPVAARATRPSRAVKRKL